MKDAGQFLEKISAVRGFLLPPGFSEQLLLRIALQAGGEKMAEMGKSIGSMHSAFQLLKLTSVKTLMAAALIWMVIFQYCR